MTLIQPADISKYNYINLCEKDIWGVIMRKDSPLAGIGYAITLDNLADTSPDSNLCFRPLEPKLESGLNIIWKKYQVFSPAAELFLNKITERFA